MDNYISKKSMNKLLIPIFCFTIFLFGSVQNAKATGEENVLINTSTETSVKILEVKGKVTKIVSENEVEVAGVMNKDQVIEVEIVSGEGKGKIISINNNGSISLNPPIFEVGDSIILNAKIDDQGGEEYTFKDYNRSSGLFWLFILFLGLTLVVARTKGLFAILSLVVSFFIIIYLLIPMLNSGFDPVLAVILLSLIILPLTFFLSHGFNRRTLIALAGTLIALILSGILSTIFVKVTHLTGMNNEDAGFLKTMISVNINFRGLLLSGMLISLLGVLDDVTISQVSLVKELYLANKRYDFKTLYSRALNVGRDHITSTINTLVLVYTGASLPLVLLLGATDLKFGEILNIEIIATEIVRTLIGSLALISAVPITTLISSFLISKGFIDSEMKKESQILSNSMK